MERKKQMDAMDNEAAAAREQMERMEFVRMAGLDPQALDEALAASEREQNTPYGNRITIWLADEPDGSVSLSIHWPHGSSLAAVMAHRADASPATKVALEIFRYAAEQVAKSKSQPVSQGPANDLGNGPQIN
jgi:hypothetical protein